jgi:hypothetical protein
VHAASQHTPSEAKVAAQLVPTAEGWPFFSLHALAASHVEVAVLQVSGSSALFTLVHAPVPAAQVWQTPLHGSEQQMPSSAMPLAQFAELAVAWPGLSLQAPEELQVEEPVHVPGSSAFVTAVQVPGVAEQDWQGEVQAEAQQ